MADRQFEYMLLDRLKGDCDYFLGVCAEAAARGDGTIAEDINDRLNTAVEWELDAIDVEWYLCEHDVEPRSQPEPSSGRDLHDILAQLGAGDGLDLDAEGREARELSEGMARRDAHERSEQIR